MTRFCFPLVSILSLSSLSMTAWADVSLPNGTVVPKPAIGCFDSKPGGLGTVFACSCVQPGVCNIGDHCSSGQCNKPNKGTCEAALWYKTNEDPCIPSNRSGLDPIKDADTKPETFKLTGGCGLTFTLLAREAQFKNAFGWYNVRADGKKPDPSDMHPLIDCNTAVGKSVTLDVSAAYKGGKVGFFLVTPQDKGSDQCAGGDCCATLQRGLSGTGYIYYSEQQFNPDSDAKQFIHLLVYKSKIQRDTFYFAWEDTFRGLSTEFTDFVTKVSGIRAACAGAGVDCDSGKAGICKAGVTACGQSPGELVCEPVHRAEDEVCDGLDNNCNGQIDDAATCPKADHVCHRGQCVPRCSSSVEFPCPQAGTECDKEKGVCVEKACKEVSCPLGQVCVRGKCGSGCDGVVCPFDQLCKAGACVDPCAGRQCKDKEICWRGVCVPQCNQCNGLKCENGLVCDQSSGRCGCEPACGPGTHCDKGSCVDDCQGVVCPLGAICAAGQCVPGCVEGRCPAGYRCKGGACERTGFTLNEAGVVVPTDAGPASGGDRKANNNNGGGGNDTFFDDGGCGCRTVGSSPQPFGWLALGLLMILRRRRKSVD